LGFEKSQRSVTHDSLRHINILTYLLTYLLRTRQQKKMHCATLRGHVSSS